MDTATRIWITAILAALLAVGIGGYDAFFNSSKALAAAGDISLIFTGLGALGLKGAYDIGVQVPTPPKA